MAIRDLCFNLYKKISLNKSLLFNVIGFQLVWFICVQGNNYVAVIAAIILFICHQFLFKESFKTWGILILFSLLGYLGDSLIAIIWDVEYRDNLYPLGPLWLLSLWLAFSTTLNHSMKWLFSRHTFSIRIILVAALSIVPLSYLAGITLSASILNNEPILFFLSESLWWAILLLSYQRLIPLSVIKG